MRPDGTQPPEEQQGPAYVHATVLKAESIALLEPRAGGLYVDATLGGGGHTEALLESADNITVLGIDRDPAALQASAQRLARFGERVQLLHASFGEVADLLAARGIQKVDGILADLGISSAQLSNGERGMSFRVDGPLDMRMNPDDGETALELMERLEQDELADVIYRYGEERRSRRVARCIKLALLDGKLESTFDLRRAVIRAVGPARTGGVDPATRTFQALRIAVNGELDQLTELLDKAPQLLSPDGVLAIISFHSLEDRLVKRAFQDRSRWQPITKKPVTASDQELEFNPRARSAKLRAARLLAQEEPEPSEERS